MGLEVGRNLNRNGRPISVRFVEFAHNRVVLDGTVGRENTFRTACTLREKNIFISCCVCVPNATRISYDALPPG